MPDDRTVDRQLTSDLAEYFAVTAAVPLPRAVTEMSSATLRAHRHPLRPFVVPAGALLTGAAVVGIGFGLAHNTSRPSFSSGSQAGGGVAPFAAKASPRHEGGDVGDVVYPGVDGELLASAGRTRLRSVAGFGTPGVSAAAAQATARASVAAGPAPAGPAILASVEDLSGAPVRCLCWVVDVPANQAPGGSGSSHTVLVFIDATTGRYAGAHREDGVP